MRNLRKFNTESEYNSATLNYPAVSWVVSDDIVHFDKETPTPSFSGLTVYYNIDDISQPTELFRGGGGSGSGSGSGSGGVLPSAMIIDGTAVEVTSAYAFDTVGEHIVNYSFADNQIPEEFLYNNDSSVFQTVKKIEIGDAITSIGRYAFSQCTGLTSCTIGNGVTSIGNNAFAGCNSIPSITIPNSVTSISDYAFQACTNLTSCTIGSGVTSIGGSAFENCTSLTSIDIPDSVTSIGDSSFYYCSSLTSITIPNSVTSIGQYAFQSCTSLSSITILSGVTSISYGAFYNCSSLTSITFPSSVTTIGDSAFYNCSGLTSITSNATTAPTIQSYTFRGVKTGGTLTVPSSSSGYDVWMQNANYYLGLYNWTKVEQ